MKKSVAIPTVFHVEQFITKRELVEKIKAGVPILNELVAGLFIALPRPSHMDDGDMEHRPVLKREWTHKGKPWETLIISADMCWPPPTSHLWANIVNN